tara:strand:+ start:1372 stop:1845 length:474 start_codon:yes stop_codon:yes gene_type:complete
MAEDKLYTVPLRKEFLKSAKYNRSKKAMKALKEYLLKHLKEEVKVGKYLNEEITKRRKSPPSKVQIRVEGEKGSYKAELANAPKEVIEKEEDTISIKKPKILQKKEDKTLEEDVKVKEETKKAIEKVPEPKKVDAASKVPDKAHAHRKQEKIISATK